VYDRVNFSVGVVGFPEFSWAWTWTCSCGVVFADRSVLLARKEGLIVSADAVGKKGDESGAMRNMMSLLLLLLLSVAFSVVLVVMVEWQGSGSAEESLDSISGFGRRISATVEMLNGAVLPRR